MQKYEKNEQKLIEVLDKLIQKIGFDSLVPLLNDYVIYIRRRKIYFTDLV